MEMEPQEKEDDLQTPTAYSHCRVSINATGCLAWQEKKLGCSEEERRKVLEPELISWEVNIPEHLYRDVGVRGIPEWTRDQVELQGCRSRDELQTKQW
jgi:hypothetical protein